MNLFTSEMGIPCSNFECTTYCCRPAIGIASEEEGELQRVHAGRHPPETASPRGLASASVIEANTWIEAKLIEATSTINTAALYVAGPVLSTYCAVSPNIVLILNFGH